MSSYPRFRHPIDIQIRQVEGQEIIVINCPLGISPEPLGLVRAVGPILASFDGKTSIDEIQVRFAAQGVPQSLITELLTLLDAHLFLETSNFHQAKAQLESDFRLSTSRPAALAGLSYAADPKILQQDLEGLLAHGTVVAPHSDPLVTLVAPHIDYRRGGMCYGITYAKLRGSIHDRFIVIGTAHQYSTLLFHLTAKDFETPLGPLTADRPMVQRIAARHGLERSFRDEMLHRREHSLELQAPFLKLLNQNAQMTAVLVGSFHHMLESGKYPEEFEEYESFTSALTEELRNARATGQRICIVAGVDMAHVGRNFGDSAALSPEQMSRIEQRDRAYLEAVCARDKRRLFDHIAEDQDARRICGFPTLYTVLDVLDRLGLRTQSSLFDYRQAVDYRTDCAVTFAGVGIYELAR